MKKYFLIVAAALFTAGISGCKKDYLSLETNPNQPSVGTPTLVLSAALNASANSIVSDYEQYGIWAGFWTASGNYVPPPNLNQYLLTSGTFTGSWGDWYAQLTNYNNLEISSAKDPSQANFQAIAMIMKAYGFQHLVDDYNDVPYTQAFQPSTILFPAYDKGSDIYEDLGKKLDAAIALIAAHPTAVSPGNSDIVFGGDMTKWAQFANTVKLRIAMRVSTKTPGDPLVTDLASTASVGYLTADAASNPGYADLAGKQNPFWGDYGIDASGNTTFGNAFNRANNFEVSMLNSFNDPRSARFFTLVPVSSTDNTQIVHGNIFGDTHATLLSNTYTSGQGPGLLKSASQDAILFSAAESYFLQAEAVNRGLLTSTSTAQQLYEAGITASFESLGLTDAQATTYYGQAIANVGWAASPNKEQAIITQKWISLTGYFNFEAWNEYRRTGIPSLPASIDPAAQSTHLPYRILYPSSEQSTNPTNLAKEGTIDPFSSKIFWMQ